MAELFRRWKNDLKTKFVDKEKTPTFNRQYEKIRDHLDAFVAHKTSEKSKKMSETNKLNSAKKELHHCTGSGGYLKARLSWDKAEQDLLDRGFRPETWNCSDRARTWFFGAGGTLDPETGKCVCTNKKLDLLVKKLRELFAASA